MVHRHYKCDSSFSDDEEQAHIYTYMYEERKKQNSAMKELCTYSFFGLKDEFEQPKQRCFAYQQLQHRKEQEDSYQETGLEEHQWPQVRIKGDPKPGGGEGRRVVRKKRNIHVHHGNANSYLL